MSDLISRTTSTIYSYDTRGFSILIYCRNFKNKCNVKLNVLDLEAIPTTQGKKLLASGFWGIVRHPNYLGDIIIQLCWLPFLSSSPPLLTVIFSIIFLLHRAIRDNARCKQKYGSAWDRYCNKVKYVLIPKVY